jgi:hypothetical protein
MYKQIFQAPVPYRMPGDPTLTGTFGQIIYPPLAAYFTTPPRIYGEEFNIVNAMFVTREATATSPTTITLNVISNNIYDALYGQTIRFDGSTGALIGYGDYIGDAEVEEIVQSTDGALWSTRNGYLSEMDPVTHVVLQTIAPDFFEIPADQEFHGVAHPMVDRARGLIVMAGYPPSNQALYILVNDLKTGALIRRIWVSGPVNQIMQEDDRRCFVICSNSIMNMVDYTTGQIISTTRTPLAEASNPFKVTYAFDRVLRRLLAFSFVNVANPDGSSPNSIAGFYPVPIATNITKPIPLRPPRKGHTAPMLVRAVGDAGEPIASLALTATATAPGSIVTGAQITDGFGYARIGLVGTDAGSSEVTVTANVNYSSPRGVSGAGSVAPTLSLPAAAQTSPTTATGTVSTDQGNGLLYSLCSTSPTATDDDVKMGRVQMVTRAGTQNVNFTGLTAGTIYYPHYLHRNGVGLESEVATGASFTTPISDSSGWIPGLTSLTGFAMSGTEEVAFLSSMSGLVNGGYFAADLTSPDGAVLLGKSGVIAPGIARGRGIVVNGTVDGQVALSGTPRAMTPTELVTFLNAMWDYRYHAPRTTPPSVTTGTPVTYPITKNGVSLTASFQVDTGYTTTQGRLMNWTPVTTGGSQWGLRAYSPTLDMAIYLSILGGEAGGDAMTTTDGVTWVSRSLGEGGDNRWKNVFFWSEQISRFIYYSLPTLPGGSYIYGIRVPYNTMWSDDGITWHELIGAPDVDWIRMEPVPSRNLVVGIGIYQGETKSGVSTDGGLTWTFHSSPALAGFKGGGLGLVWSEEQSQFVVVLPSDNGLGAATSPDGVTWTLRDTPVGTWTRLAWLPDLGLYIAGGESRPMSDVVENNPYAWCMMYSSDGVTWTPNNDVFFPLSVGAPIWVEEQGRYLAFANITNSEGSESWTAYVRVSISSTDGIHWDRMQPVTAVDMFHIPEWGKYIAPNGYTDGTAAPDTTYYWPYDHWNITYALPAGG